MDFSDELPCGGYEQQDKKIQHSLEKLSLQSQGVVNGEQKCKKQCQNQCSCCEQCSCKCNKKQQKKVQPKKKVQCKKCKQNQAVLVHKNQQICKQCLMKNIEYKTRLTLENKIKVTAKSKILICFSGGLNSICLAQIISNIKKRYQKSPLFGHAECIHIQQQSKIPQGYSQKFQKITGLKLNVLPISNIYGKQNNRQFQHVKKLFKTFKKNTNTIDLLNIFRNKLILQFAKQKQFDFVLMGKNGQSLASQIFKYFAKGIGGSAPQLSSSQPGPFEYPLRQHLQKQLQYYFYNEKLGNLSLMAQEDDLSNFVFNQIDSFLDQFIVTLQDRYSHTAPAIVRTGEKIKSNLAQSKQCSCCWIKHDRNGNLCQKCNRLKQLIKDEQIWKLMPQWTLPV